MNPTLLPSVVRTFVPLAVGWLLSLPVVAVLGLTETQATAAVTAVVTAVYYLLARLVELYVPRVGAVLIGLGVSGPTYQADGRHELGRGSDPEAGRAMTVLLVVVLATGAALLAAVPAAAGAEHRPGPVLAPRVSDTGICDTTLVVWFDAARLSGRQWLPVLDDGRAQLELLEVSGRSGPDGVWTPIATVSGGEHVLRWPGWGQAAGWGQHYELARIVAGGYRSVPAPILMECGA